MLRTTFTPLRRGIGPTVPIANVRIASRADELGGFTPTLRVNTGVAPVLETDFSGFLPEFIRTSGSADRFTPIQGAGTLPRPVTFPDGNGGGPCVSVYGITDVPPEKSSRRLWIELELTLAEPTLVGGIVYAGHPSLPYTIDNFRELSSNAGLPREARLSWRDPASDFLDDETAVVEQEPSAHGGWHYICGGPIRTKQLFVRFSDFPRFIRSGLYTAADFREVEERFGLCVPFLFVFEHRETTRFVPRVAGATLAAVKFGADGKRTPGELIYMAHAPDKRYFQLSAGSVFGQSRKYASSGTTMKEKFTSVPLGDDDSLVLYVDQADDHARCLAGLRLATATSALKGLQQIPSVHLAIYELDPRQGFSALGQPLPQDDRFATRLFESLVPAAGETVARFVRPTASRHLALVFSRPASEPVLPTPGPPPTPNQGHFNISIASIELIQSAFVSIVPRPSRTQNIACVHYRLIGEGLLDDYSRLGEHGFSLSVERVVAGERKEVLFSANSLLDLVQEGGARIVANHRYYETVKDTWSDTTTTLCGSWDQHTAYAYADGWTRSETGAGVAWTDGRDTPKGFEANGDAGFEAFGNTENRSRVELLGSEGLWGQLEDIRTILTLMFPGIPWPADPTGGSALVRGLTGRGLKWKDDVWRGQTVDSVGLVRQLSLPPWVAVPSTFLQGVVDGLEQLRDWIGAGTFPPTGPLPTFPANIDPLMNLIGQLPLLNGTNVSFSMGASYVVGANLGFSWAPVLPTLGFQSTDGSQGNITQQAQETGYSYAQHKNKNVNVTRNKAIWDESEPTMKRRSARELDTDSVVRRRQRGAEVMWQGEYADVVVGKIPIDIVLPATAGRMYRTTDEAIAVRFGGGMASDVLVDVWFDLQEEWVRDDS
jgi:hypothetical protein